jgi:hypothetical protein
MVAQTRNKFPHLRELAPVRRHEGAIHEDQVKPQLALRFSYAESHK